MKAINTKWIGIAVGMILSIVPSVAQANDPGFCFMKTSSGKVINLEQLCLTTKSDTGDVRIPIKYHLAKTAVIDVIFNGTYVTEMVVDSGASGILITQTTADALKVKSTGKTKDHLADGSIATFDTGTIDTVAVGSLVVNSPTVTIAPKATIGLLGHGFLDNYDFQIEDQFIKFHKR